MGTFQYGVVFTKWRLYCESQNSIIHEKSSHDCCLEFKVFIDFFHGQRTINAVYYCRLLRKVKLAYRSKTVSRQCETPYPRTTQRTLEYLHREHPPCSSDLPPCDWWPFFCAIEESTAWGEIWERYSRGEIQKYLERIGKYIEKQNFIWFNK